MRGGAQGVSSGAGPDRDARALQGTDLKGTAMLKQNISYSIECDDCGMSLCPVNFKTRGEAENYGLGNGSIRSVDGGSTLCEACRAKGRKCVVKACVNHAGEGAFVGDLCSPCHRFIVDGTINNSQACRNAFKQVGSSVRALVALVEDGKIKILRDNGLDVDGTGRDGS